MRVLGFRFCTVSPEASNLASFLDAIGFERHPLEGGAETGDAFTGAVFAAGESWLAMWPPSEQMRPGMMLQVVVDDADAFAVRAREQGLNPAGPTDAQGKRIYFLQAPTGLQISIQSRLVGHSQSVPVPGPPPPAARESVPSKGPPPLPARGKSVPAQPEPSPAVAKRPAPAAAKQQPAAKQAQPIPPVSAPPGRGKGLPAPPATAARAKGGPAPLPPGVRAMTIPVPPAGVFRRASADARRPKP